MTANGRSKKPRRTPLAVASADDDARRRAPDGGPAQASTADRLLETAAALFRRKGYATSSTRELALLLGIQKASLYHHISGKEELLLAICERSLRRITEDVGAVAAAEPPETRLEAMIHRHVASALRDRDMHAVMLMELRALSPDRYAEVVKRRARYEKLLNEVVAEEQLAGRLRRDTEAKYLTLALLNVLNWTIFWYDPEGEMSPDELGRLLGRIFLEGARGDSS